MGSLLFGLFRGKLFLRSDCAGIHFPHQVNHRPAAEADLAEIVPYIEEYCEHFGGDAAEILSAAFTVVTPDSGNPYQQMYVAN